MVATQTENHAVYPAQAGSSNGVSWRKLAVVDPASNRSRRFWRPLRRVLSLILVLTLVGVLLNITGCMESMFFYPERGATPVPAEFKGAEKITFDSADGTELVGWFIPSQLSDTPAERAPTILHVHGNAGNITSHIGFTDYLPAAGFNLMIFDYRGYGESAGSARRRGPLLADTNAAIDNLLTRDDVDAQRIGMYGQSLGGAIGLSVMHDRPELRAAVIESAFSSWRGIAASAVGGSSPGPIARFIAWALIRDHNRPVDAIAAIDRPILIIHGTDDSIIPINHGRDLAAAGPTAELWELPGGDHNSLRWTHPEIEQRVVDFFRQQLQAVNE